MSKARGSQPILLPARRNAGVLYKFHPNVEYLSIHVFLVETNTFYA